MQYEHVILLDDDGQPSGTLEKYAAHGTHTPLHLAFSCWLFNSQGQLLVTRRSLGKKAWPGVWTNSVCGHPQTGETPEQAIIRRCRYEVGIDVAAIAIIDPDFRYCETDPSGIMENEICPVYAGWAQNAVRANPDEVMDVQWVEPEALFRAIDATPWAFSPWMVQEATAKMRDALRQFASALTPRMTCAAPGHISAS